MAHRCVHCGEIYPPGSKELLEGCSNCGSHFFFYIRDELIEKIKEGGDKIIEMPSQEKKRVEKEIRDMAGITDEETPVILDVESIKISAPGKFEIDLVNLFKKDRPLIYRIGEGKYLIDLSSTLTKDIKSIKAIRGRKKK